jgi:hypothetical protein
MKKRTRLLKNKLDLQYGPDCYISNTRFDDDDFKNKNVIQLNCGHSFKYNYFMKSRYHLNKNIYTYSKCPYCMESISEVPFIINKYTFNR